MTDTKSTDTRHRLRAGDTPALGLPIQPGRGGKRRKVTPDDTAPIAVDGSTDPTVVIAPVDRAREDAALADALLEEFPHADAQLAAAALVAEDFPADPELGARRLIAVLTPKPGLWAWLCRWWTALVWFPLAAIVVRVVDAVTAGFEEIGDNVRGHAALLAKALLVLLAAAVFAGVGIAWWLQ
ncbi:hypothetical protein NQK81_13450 [Amycolatopsis roodepoortensis]|uniref:hypothetical protein n=1 Tax=Amycolatopsis roodepoortensis TaxID=700274 RepID=UPI00214B8A09|nr:hypothetical protein [Amycolatopsis roodepoortensis]UUV34411.1 hypothetical protein NQK81_13450 [Amycolatopsis roodepoortensis]